MKYVFQFLIILAFAFAGEVLHWLIPLPVPASIYGIILLFAALELKIVKVKDIREVSSFLLAAMPIMFMPAAVGLMDSWGLVKGSAVQFVVTAFVSTFVVMGAAALTTQVVIKRRKKQ